MGKDNVAVEKPDIKIEYFTDKIDSTWDVFVGEINGDIYQTSSWADYAKNHKCWLNHRFCIKKGNDIIAGCQINIIAIRFLGKIGYMQCLF